MHEITTPSTGELGGFMPAGPQSFEQSLGQLGHDERHETHAPSQTESSAMGLDEGGHLGGHGHSQEYQEWFRDQEWFRRPQP